MSQMRDSEEHPVLYLSRKIIQREKNYASIEKESLAVKWAVESLRYYYHAPLKWMYRQKDKNAKVT